VAGALDQSGVRVAMSKGGLAASVNRSGLTGELQNGKWGARLL
jgi:hypothetical protein